MKYSFFLLLVIAFSFTRCSDKPTGVQASIGPVENQILTVLNHPETQFFYTRDKIPAEMLAKVSESEGYTSVAELSMANRDEDFQLGCCSIPSRILPRNHLIFVASLQDQQVLYYESGGIGHSMTLCYAENKDGQYHFYQGSLSSVEDYTNLEQVKLAIKEARFLVDKEHG